MASIAVGAAQLAGDDSLPRSATLTWCAVLALVFVAPPRNGEEVSEWAAAMAGVVSALMLTLQAWILGGLDSAGIVYVVMLPVLYQVLVRESLRVTVVVGASAIVAIATLAWASPETEASLVRAVMSQTVAISAVAVLASFVYGRRRGREQQLEQEREDALEELSLSEARRERTESVAELGMLTVGTAHEMKNMLTAVEANLSFAADATDRLAREEALADASEAARRMRDLVSDMHQVTRVDETGLVDVSEAARLAVRLVRPTLDDVATLVLDVQTVPPIRAETGRVAQALLNLMLNAAQAMEHADPAKNRIGLRTWAKDDHVYIEVHDNGHGIPVKDQERIWESFYSTKAEQGTGLGLPLVQRVARSAGGEMLLHSTPGVGSSFTMVLPAAGLKRLRVLVVDDDALVGRSVGRLLGSEFTVTVCSSVEDALGRMSTTRFDAVVTDVVMPVQDGLDLYEAIEDQYPHMAQRVVFVSGQSARSIPPTPRVPLSKPLRQQDLVEAVMEVTR